MNDKLIFFGVELIISRVPNIIFSFLLIRNVITISCRPKQKSEQEQ